jgi:hypothetical protein
VTATFTATPTVFVPVTGDPSLGTLCVEQAGVLRWTLQNPNSFAITFSWWVPGGSATSINNLTVAASDTLVFTTPVEGAPTPLAIMWVDPVDSTIKILQGLNAGTPCGGEQPTPTPVATTPPGVLIPVTGLELPSIFRESIFLNLGIGVFGFALILMGIGIKMDRKDEEDEGYEYEFDDEG